MASSNLIQGSLTEDDGSASTALKNPKIRQAFDDACEFGLRHIVDEAGNDYRQYEAVLPEGGGIFGISGKVTAGPHELLRVGERLPKASFAEVEEFIPKDWRDQVYPREIQRILEFVEASRRMNAAILFDRYLPDTVIEEILHGLPDQTKLMTSVGTFNLSLPYLDKVTPERLMELREQIPEEFRHFRVDMLKLAQDAQNQALPLQDAMDQLVLPQVLTLKKEMESISNRKHLLAYEVPAIMAMGLLAGSLLGMPLNLLLPVVGGGGLLAAKEYADAQTKAAQNEAHPFYFLWRAREPR